jgi:hypothetical protein
MCSLEQKLVEQNNLRCSHMQKFVGQCYDFANNNKLTFNFAGWRDKVNCRKIFIYFLNS